VIGRRDGRLTGLLITSDQQDGLLIIRAALMIDKLVC
jgi:hypothetical protein